MKRLISIFIVLSVSMILVSVTSFAVDDSNSSEDVTNNSNYVKSASGYCNHDWSEWYTVDEPSCDYPGTEERFCYNCDMTETRKIPGLTHEWSDWEIVYDDDGYSDAFRYCYNCDADELVIGPERHTIRNTISNSAKGTCDVIWDNDAEDYCKYQLAWRPKDGKWLFRNVNSCRGQAYGLKVGSLYEIKVRPYIDLPDTSEKLFGVWSDSVYRYFHTTQKIRLASRSKGSFTMSWAKNPKATGYQILYTTNKNGAGAANNIVNLGANTTSVTRKTIKVGSRNQALKSGTTYYVQVREIRKVGGINFIGNISCPVAVKVK
jgi:hypothetical protein